MKHVTIFATAFGMLLAGTALADELPTVAEIESSTDLTAIQNEEAATYWADIDADLESAIAARLVDRLGEEGLRIAITIDEVKLSNAFEQALEPDLSILSGDIRVTDPARDLTLHDFAVTASARQIMPLFPEGAEITVLPADSPEFYETLVNAFADGVADNIDG